MKHLSYLLLFFLFSFSGIMQAQKQDSIKVLWIGNSYTYTNNLPKMVQDIASTKKTKLSCTRSLYGGERLSGHLKRESLHNYLSNTNWDYVIIQEQSANPAKPTQQVLKEVYPYAQKITQQIRKNSPQAHIIFYMTWGHKYGNLENVKNYPLDDTYEGMQNRIITTYLEMTYQNNAWCAPVGIAWKRVRQERPDYVLYNQDLSHPSLLGSYLAANVIFCTMYQKEYQTDFTADLRTEDAEYIQRIAQSTVLNNLELLNIKNDTNK